MPADSISWCDGWLGFMENLIVGSVKMNQLMMFSKHHLKKGYSSFPGFVHATHWIDSINRLQVSTTIAMTMAQAGEVKEDMMTWLPAWTIRKFSCSLVVIVEYTTWFRGFMDFCWKKHHKTGTPVNQPVAWDGMGVFLGTWISLCQNDTQCCTDTWSSLSLTGWQPCRPDYRMNHQFCCLSLGLHVISVDSFPILYFPFAECWNTLYIDHCPTEWCPEKTEAMRYNFPCST